MSPEALALEIELLQRALEESSTVPPEEVSFVLPEEESLREPEALAPVPLAVRVLSVVLSCDMAAAAKSRRPARCIDSR